MKQPVPNDYCIIFISAINKHHETYQGLSHKYPVPYRMYTTYIPIIIIFCSSYYYYYYVTILLYYLY